MHPAAVFAAVLVLYLASAPRTVCLEDDGLFLMAGYTNGVAHAPGYPLLTLLAHLASLLPFGTVPLRIHGLSAVCGAFACALLWSLARRLGVGLLPAYLAALALALSVTFWSQAIIAEAYTLNALLFLLLLGLVLRYAAGPEPRLLKGAALAYGLGLSNHWPLLVLATPALAAPLWPVRRQVLRALPEALIYLLLGLTPYAWMVLRSWQDPIVSVFGPLDSWQDVWQVISRHVYADVDASPSAGWADRLRFVGFLAAESLRQLGPVGLALSLWGLVGQWRRWPRPLAVGLTAGWPGGTLILISLLGFDYDPLHVSGFRVYPLLSYAIMALWLGLGADLALGRARLARLPTGLVHLGLALLVLAPIAIVGARANLRAGDRWADRFALAVLDTLPPHAILLVSADEHVLPIGYLQVVEKRRPDVTLYVPSGEVFSNRLVDPIHPDPELERAQVRRLILPGGRPVYTFGQEHFGYGVRELGLYRQIDPAIPGGHLRLGFDPRIWRYLREVASGPMPVDLWSGFQRGELLEEYGRLLQLTDKLPASRALLAECEARPDCAESYYFLLGRIEAEVLKREPDSRAMLALARRAQPLAAQAVTKEDRARLPWLQGRLQERLGDSKAAQASFATARELWPSPDNPANPTAAQ